MARKTVIDEANKKLLLTMEELIERKGREMAILHNITRGYESSTRDGTGLLSNSSVMKVRRLKFGMVPNAYTTRKATWESMDHREKSEKMLCNCKHGGVQDMYHLVYECGWFQKGIDEVLKRTGGILKETGIAIGTRRWTGQRR